MSIKFLKESTNLKASLSLTEELKPTSNLLLSDKVSKAFGTLTTQDLILHSQQGLSSVQTYLCSNENKNGKEGNIITSTSLSETEKKVLKLKKILQECIMNEPSSNKVGKLRIKSSSLDQRSLKDLSLFWRSERMLREMKRIVSL